MGYHKVDDRVHAIPKKVLSGTVKDFYSRMYFRCNHKNKSWWGHEKLAEHFQVSMRTIRRWCQKLRGLEMIETQRTGRASEMSIIHLTEEDFRGLGVPEEVLMKAREDTDVPSDQTPMSHQIGHQRPIHIKGKEKTKKKTDGRITMDDMWGDSDVQASGKRAVEAAKNRKGHAVLSPESPMESSEKMWPPEVEPAEPDDATLSKWAAEVWAKHFVFRMNKAGYRVAFQKYSTTVPAHIGAIKDHLLNREFSRLKIYRFLLGWFPDVYSSICSSVFKKSPEDSMFSVSWMEPRLDELVRLYEEEDNEPLRAPKITVMD